MLTKTKAQIALEFLLVFAFVLLVFVFMFALIASQRSTGLSYQSFSQLQLIAEDVAMQINTAANAGSNYVASVPVASLVGITPYNLTITKNGIVIASMYIGKQLVQARAYSNAKNIISNASFAISPNLYKLPIASGTLSLQNYYGSVCIDYNCGSSASVATAINLSAENVHAASFNGQSSNVTLSNTASLESPAVTNRLTVSMWLYSKQLYSGGGCDTAFAQNYNGADILFAVGVTDGGGGCLGAANTAYAGFYVSNWYYTNTPSPFPINQWVYVTATFNGTYIKLYENGHLVSTSGAISAALPASSNPFFIGRRWDYNGVGNAWNGSIANVQIYNTVLSATQIQQLYQEGIGAAPIDLQNLVGWWPLNGNANDYSGNGNNGVIHGPLLFTAVSQLFAKATNQFGAPVANDLVGFATTLGNFSNGISHGSAASNLTNTDGIATVFLNQQLNNGYALVKATAFNGNSSLSSNVIAWYPLNFGQGKTAYDLSGNGNSGNMVDSQWSSQNYVASFDGGYMGAANSSSLSPTATMSMFAWVNPSSTSTAIIQKQGSYGMKIGVQGAASGQFAGYVWGASNGGACSSYPFALVPGRWYLVGFTFNGVAINDYVDGNLYCTVSYSSSIPVSNSPLAFGGLQDTDGYISGSLANVQIYNSVLTPSQVLQLYIEGISAPPFSSGLAAWYPLDGNANDYSGNGNNATIYGNVTFGKQDVAQGINASGILAASFNGANSVITLPITFNTPAFAVTLWVNGANTLKMESGNGYTIFNSSGSDNFQAWLNNGGALGAVPGAGDEEVGFGTNYYHGYGINGSSWNFIGISVSNGKLSFYANGADPYNVSIVNGPYSLNALAIAQSAAGVSPFAGSIANLQLYNQTLTPSQVSQIYREGISGLPLYGLKTIAWYPLDGNANDYSGNGNNGVPSNIIYTSQVSSQLPLVSSLNGYGINFNGKNGYITIPPLQTLNGHHSFTINTWIMYKGGAQYFSQNPFPLGWPGCHAGFTYAGNSQTPYLEFFEWYSPTSNKPAGCVSGNGGIAPAAALVQPNAWYMLTGTYNLSSNLIAFYVNGKLFSTASVPAGDYLNNYTETGYIGDALDGNTGTQFFNGTVADVQIFNTTLSAQQVWQLYQNSMPPSQEKSIGMSWYP